MVLRRAAERPALFELEGSGRVDDTGSFAPAVGVVFTGSGQELDLGQFAAGQSSTRHQWLSWLATLSTSQIRRHYLGYSAVGGPNVLLDSIRSTC